MASRSGNPEFLLTAGAGELSLTLLAVGAGELSLVLFVLVAVAVPVAAIAFARSGKGLEDLGKGTFAVDFDEGHGDERGDEVRQMVEARAWRRESRGEDPGDVDAEIEQLLALDPDGPAEPAATPGPPDPGGPAPAPEGSWDELSGIRDEIRQVVIANNERRERRGEEPLEVETEVERRLRELSPD